MSRRVNKENKKIFAEKVSERKRSWKIFKEDVHINVQNTTFKNRLTAFSKLLLLIFIMVGIPIIMFFMFKNTLFNKNYLLSLPKHLSTHKYIAFLPLISLQTLQIIISILPGQPIQFASSYVYGIWIGYLISIIGALIGSVITYYLANFLGSESLHLLFGEQRVKDYVKKLNSRRAYTIIFFIYLIPGIPKDMVSYVAGISNIKIKPFLLISTLGRTPGLFESLLFGMFWAKKNYLGLMIVSLVTLGILIICYKKRASLMKFLDSYEDEDSLDNIKEL